MTRRMWMIGGGVIAAAAIVIVATVLVLGGDDSSTRASGPAGEGGVPAFAPSEELQDCLAEQGIDTQSGAAPVQPGADQAEALQACQEFLPSGGIPQGAPPGGVPAVPGG
jgi:hypothetical protein